MNTIYKLTIQDNKGTNTVVPLMQSTPAYKIGKRAGNHIQLTQGELAPVHAIITREGDDYVIEDQGSEGGTFANGRRLEGPHRIGLQDVLQIGDYRLTLSLVPESLSHDLNIP